MEQNDLKLNPDKTEILLIHSRFREGPPLDYLQFGDERISISDKVTSLGVIVDMEYFKYLEYFNFLTDLATLSYQRSYLPYKGMTSRNKLVIQCISRQLWLLPKLKTVFNQ